MELSQQPDQVATAPGVGVGGRLGRLGGSLVLLGVGLFAVSTALPIIASLIAEDRLPPWVGFFDVGLAGVVVVLALLLDQASKGTITPAVQQTSYRVFRGAAAVPLLLLVIFFLAGEHLRWNVLLPGLAWRTWLLLYTLPAGLAVWTGRAPRRQAGAS